jgi:hypothetical protein
MIDRRYTIRVTDGELLMTVRTEESIESCKNAVGNRVERWIDRARLVSAEHATQKALEYSKWWYEITDDDGLVMEEGPLSHLPAPRGVTWPE